VHRLLPQHRERVARHQFIFRGQRVDSESAISCRLRAFRRGCANTRVLQICGRVQCASTPSTAWEAAPAKGRSDGELAMGATRFLDFVVDSSIDSIAFAEFEGGPPLWVIDTKLFAGQPSLSINTRTRVRATVTRIVLSGARYPGTTLPADLSIEIIEAPGDENQSASQEVTLELAFGNASFDWSFAPIDTDPQTQTDPFLEWLNKRAPATTSISIGGTAVTF